MPEFINLEVADAIAVVTLQRPPMNALSVQVQSEIFQIASELARREDVRAVVLHGGERLFAAGADVKEMADMDYQAMIGVSLRLEEAFSAVSRLPQPSIAAITGFALGGGCELALACDFRVAGDNARLGQPEILLGLIPGAGGTQRLPRLIGVSKAKELIFSGRFVEAQEALAIGLVDVVVPSDQVLARAMEWAAQLAAGPRIAMQAAKRVIDRGLDVDLETGLELERAAFSSLFATEDRVNGMQSFIENGPGKATFTGR
ncbi:MAG: enoyl-CoA hydratase-related protein [Actinomycetota bacterium]|nr:enoyl-CoA hydratase-related protein [Actinomycetota bacterium]